MKGFGNILMLFSFLLMLSGCSDGGKGPSVSRPNIVLIVADDLGYDDLGCHGNTILQTPNLDRLAGESVQFSQFYVTPVCATTRASLLTGRHFIRTGVSHVHGGKDFLHLEEITLAEVLKEAGYVTGMWGKWHSGKTPGYFPWERGFDEAYMAGLYDHFNNRGLFNGKAKETSGWMTGLLTDFAIDFISRHRDSSFFAYIPYLACHAPLEAPEAFVGKYISKGISENLATLYGMVDQMDHHIGRLLAALEEMGLSEKTLVLFLSDNGPAILNGRLTDMDRRIRYVNGLRGHKGNIWENGIKSPLFVRWKGHYTPRMVNNLTDVTDLFPTLSELAGNQTDPDSLELDGRSMADYLLGDTATPGDKVTCLYANPGWPPTDRPWTPEGVRDEYRPWKYSDGDQLGYHQQIMGIREQRYKLLFNPGPTDGTINPDDSGYVLVDILRDPGEQVNLAADSADLLAGMKQLLRQWHTDLFDDPHAFEMPLFRIDADPTILSTVLAYAPRRISRGVKNASNYIHHFHCAEDSAVYQLDVIEGGIYTIEFRYRMQDTETQPFDLVIPQGVYRLEFKAGGNRISVEDVPFHEGLTIFTLKNVTDRPGSDLRLFQMIFHQMKS